MKDLKSSSNKNIDDYELDIGTWYIIAVDYDGDTLRTYVNGKLYGSAHCNAVPHVAGSSLNIGDKNATKDDFKFLLHEIKVYNNWFPTCGINGCNNIVRGDYIYCDYHRLSQQQIGNRMKYLTYSISATNDLLPDYVHFFKKSGLLSYLSNEILFPYEINDKSLICNINLTRSEAHRRYCAWALFRMIAYTSSEVNGHIESIQQFIYKHLDYAWKLKAQLPDDTIVNKSQNDLIDSLDDNYTNTSRIKSRSVKNISVKDAESLGIKSKSIDTIVAEDGHYGQLDKANTIFIVTCKVPERCNMLGSITWRIKARAELKYYVKVRKWNDETNSWLTPTLYSSPLLVAPYTSHIETYTHLFTEPVPLQSGEIYGFYLHRQSGKADTGKCPSGYLPYSKSMYTKEESDDASFTRLGGGDLCFIAKFYDKFDLSSPYDNVSLLQAPIAWHMLLSRSGTINTIAQIELYCNEMLWVCLRCITNENLIKTLAQYKWVYLLYNISNGAKTAISRVLALKLLSLILSNLSPNNPIFHGLHLNLSTNETSKISKAELSGYGVLLPLLKQAGQRVFPWNLCRSKVITDDTKDITIRENISILRVLLSSLSWNNSVNSILLADLSLLKTLHQNLDDIFKLFDSHNYNKISEFLSTDIVNIITQMQRIFATLAVLSGYHEEIAESSVVKVKQDGESYIGTVVYLKKTDFLAKVVLANSEVLTFHNRDDLELICYPELKSDSLTNRKEMIDILTNFLYDAINLPLLFSPKDGYINDNLQIAALNVAYTELKGHCFGVLLSLVNTNDSDIIMNLMQQKFGQIIMDNLFQSQSNKNDNINEDSLTLPKSLQTIPLLKERILLLRTAYDKVTQEETKGQDKLDMTISPMKDNKSSNEYKIKLMNEVDKDNVNNPMLVKFPQHAYLLGDPLKFFHKEMEAVKEPEPTEWSCEACTYRNTASRKRCEMCETRRPAPIKKGTSQYMVDYAQNENRSDAPSLNEASVMGGEFVNDLHIGGITFNKSNKGITLPIGQNNQESIGFQFLLDLTAKTKNDICLIERKYNNNNQLGYKLSIKRNALSDLIDIDKMTRDAIFELEIFNPNNTSEIITKDYPIEVADTRAPREFALRNRKTKQYLIYRNTWKMQYEPGLLLSKYSDSDKIDQLHIRSKKVNIFLKNINYSSKTDVEVTKTYAAEKMSDSTCFILQKEMGGFITLSNGGKYLRLDENDDITFNNKDIDNSALWKMVYDIPLDPIVHIFSANMRAFITRDKRRSITLKAINNVHNSGQKFAIEHHADNTVALRCLNSNAGYVYLSMSPEGKIRIRSNTTKIDRFSKIDLSNSVYGPGFVAFRHATISNLFFAAEANSVRSIRVSPQAEQLPVACIFKLVPIYSQVFNAITTAQNIDNKEFKIYFNNKLLFDEGKSINWESIQTNNLINNSKVLIGCEFRGTIKQICYWNDILSSAQAGAFANSGVDYLLEVKKYKQKILSYAFYNNILFHGLNIFKNKNENILYKPKGNEFFAENIQVHVNDFKNCINVKTFNTRIKSTSTVITDINIPDIDQNIKPNEVMPILQLDATNKYCTSVLFVDHWGNLGFGGGKLLETNISSLETLNDLKTSNNIVKIHNVSHDELSSNNIIPNKNRIAISDGSNINLYDLNIKPKIIDSNDESYHSYNESLYKTLSHDDCKSNIRCMLRIPNTNYLICGHEDGTIVKWCLETYERITSRFLFKMIAKMELTKDNKNIVITVAETAQLLNFELETCRVFEGHTNGVWGLAVLDDSQRIVTGSYDDTAKVWDIETGQCLVTFTEHTDDVNTVVALSDDRVATGSDDWSIKIWYASNGELIYNLTGHAGYVISLAVLPDGRLISGSRDCTICIWDIDRGIRDEKITAHENAIKSVASTPDGRIISTSSDDSWRIFSANDFVLESKTNVSERCIAQCLLDIKNEEKNKYGLKVLMKDEMKQHFTTIYKKYQVGSHYLKSNTWHRIAISARKQSINVFIDGKIVFNIPRKSTSLVVDNTLDETKISSENDNLCYANWDDKLLLGIAPSAFVLNSKLDHSKFCNSNFNISCIQIHATGLNKIEIKQLDSCYNEIGAYNYLDSGLTFEQRFANETILDEMGFQSSWAKNALQRTYYNIKAAVAYATSTAGKNELSQADKSADSLLNNKIMIALGFPLYKIKKLLEQDKVTLQQAVIELLSNINDDKKTNDMIYKTVKKV